MNSTVEEVLAESSPAMLIPRLTAMDQERKLQEDYRRRLYDGHEAMMLAMGLMPSPMTKDEEMGDINVANHKHYYGSNQTVGVEQEDETVPSNSNGAPVTAKPRFTKEDLRAYIKRKVAEGIAQQKRPPIDWKKYLWPALAALGLSSAGGMAIYNYTKSDTVTQAPGVDTNTQYKFDISSEQGKGFSTE